MTLAQMWWNYTELVELQFCEYLCILSKEIWRYIFHISYFSKLRIDIAVQEEACGTDIVLVKLSDDFRVKMGLITT